MCGIAGFVEALNPEVAQRKLQQMCDVIAHRGPDAEGQYHDGAVHLGHRRLSIIARATGQQPMTSAATGNTIIYNGEVYNHALLAETLAARDSPCVTGSDTEAILKGYDVFGLDVLGQLRGMFAFALWDPSARRLVLVRDRVGIKPLYWSLREGRLAFGSELKTVLASGIVDKRVDPSALDDYLAHGFIRGAATIYRDVQRLRPGEYACFKVDDDGAVELERLERYWQLPDPGSEITDLEEARERLREKFDEAVRIRLMSEVPLGAFLSGGIDSSTVVWLMAQHLPRVRTFSIAFDHDSYDESSVARAVARHFDTDHHEELVVPSAIEALPAVIASHDEPFGDPSAIPTWYLSRMARKEVVVCLSGDGGDELFAGYSRYSTIAHELGGGVSLGQKMRAVPGALLTPIESRARNKAERLGLPPELHYARFRAIFSPAMRQRLYRQAFGRRVDMDGTHLLFAQLSPAQKARGPVERAQACDFNVYLPDDVLTKVDRASMAHSLEVRVPLLDHELVTLAQRIPLSMKMQGDVQKAILRSIIEPHLPREVLEHPKQGFSVPLSSWFRRELKDKLLSLPERPLFQTDGWFDGQYMRRLTRLHRSGRMDLSWQLWVLLVLAEWVDQQGGMPAL